MSYKGKSIDLSTDLIDRIKCLQLVSISISVLILVLLQSNGIPSILPSNFVSNHVNYEQWYQDAQNVHSNVILRIKLQEHAAFVVLTWILDNIATQTQITLLPDVQQHHTWMPHICNHSLIHLQVISAMLRQLRLIPHRRSIHHTR